MINMLFYQTLAITVHGKKIKKSYKNNKFQISSPTLNEHFELPDGSYSVSDIQNHLEYVIKKLETITDNSSIRMYVNKIENRIIFKIKDWIFY